jgi:hypothetical protein
MLVAKYAKAFCRTSTRPFLFTCRVRGGHRLAIPRERMCAICSPLAQRPPPCSAISRITIMLSGPSRRHPSTWRRCGMGKILHISSNPQQSFPTPTATVSRSPSTESRGASNAAHRPSSRPPTSFRFAALRTPGFSGKIRDARAWSVEVLSLRICLSDLFGVLCTPK